MRDTEVKLYLIPNLDIANFTLFCLQEVSVKLLSGKLLDATGGGAPTSVIESDCSIDSGFGISLGLVVVC